MANDDNPVDREVIAKLKDMRDPYILGFTSLNKVGAYLKFEAKPHAIALYKPVVIAGSTISDWKRVFLNIEPPRIFT